MAAMRESVREYNLSNNLTKLLLLEKDFSLEVNSVSVKLLTSMVAGPEIIVSISMRVPKNSPLNTKMQSKTGIRFNMDSKKAKNCDHL